MTYINLRIVNKQEIDNFQLNDYNIKFFLQFNLQMKGFMRCLWNNNRNQNEGIRINKLFTCLIEDGNENKLHGTYKKIELVVGIMISSLHD